MGCSRQGSVDESLFQIQTSSSEHRDVVWYHCLVSCRSLSGARGIAMALEGFVGILIILPKMRREWWFQFSFLRGVLQAERRFFIGGTFNFMKEPLGASFGVSGQ